MNQLSTISERIRWLTQLNCHRLVDENMDSTYVVYNSGTVQQLIL